MRKTAFLKAATERTLLKRKFNQEVSELSVALNFSCSKPNTVKLPDITVY